MTRLVTHPRNTTSRRDQKIDDKAAAAIVRRYIESLKRRYVDGQADTVLEKERK